MKEGGGDKRRQAKRGVKDEDVLQLILPRIEKRAIKLPLISA